jgi:hypothetical protein
MHLYLRVLQQTGMESYSASEKQYLFDLLSKAPEVEHVKEVQRNNKGGYAVTLEVSQKSLNALIEFISSHGLLAVM